MVINVDVVNQELMVATNLKCLAKGTQEFVQFIFTFHDNSWDDLTTFAQFIQGNNTRNVYLDENNSVYLPSEIDAGDCLLMLYGTGGDVIGTTKCIRLVITDNRFVADAQSTVITESLYQQMVNYVEAQIRDVEEKFGSPLVAETLADMTDQTRVYVYTGNESGMVNGNWYYWDGSAWTSGGAYNSSALNTDTTLTIAGMAADSKTVGDAIGVLSNLNTTAKSNLVAAINEVKECADTNKLNIGTLSNLTTINKSNLVSAINEVNTALNDLGLSVVNGCLCVTYEE